MTARHSVGAVSENVDIELQRFCGVLTTLINEEIASLFFECTSLYSALLCDFRLRKQTRATKHIRFYVPTTMCVLYHCNALYKPVEYTEGSKITCSQALQAITNRTANLSHSRFSPIICSAPICHTVSSPLSLLLRQSVMQQTFACRTYHANLSCSRLLPIIS